MSNIAIRTEVIPGATLTALTIPRGLSESEWEAIGEKLGRAGRGWCWWVGDWINYGEDAGYISREKYDRAEKLTGLARKTLRNYASISRHYESSLRRDDLSFWKHSLALSANGRQEKPPYEAVTERQKQIAAKAARKVHEALAGVRGYCQGLAGIDIEKAIAGATEEDIEAWERLARDISSSFSGFRRAVKERKR